jgi:putative aldouronate transport system substrate-binding protein
MVHLSRRSALAAAGAGAFAMTMAACGNGDDDDTKGQNLSANKVAAMDKYGVGDQFKATQPLSFPILYNNHPNYQIKNDWLFWSELTKRTNVTLQPQVIPLSDYEQKRSLLIGSGDIPPIIPKTYPFQEVPFVGSGAILPISDYYHLMPNFTDKVNKWKLQTALDQLRQQDGKIYLLPGLHEANWPDYTLAVRTDVLGELGLATPKTWNDVYSMLKAMKARYPNSYPMSDRFSKPTPAGNLLNLLAQANATNAGWNYRNATWNAKAKTFQFTGAMGEYKQVLQFLDNLVKEGLLDPETFTQTDDQAIQKFASGKSFVISTNAQNIVNDYRPALAKSLPNAKIAKIPVPMGAVGPMQVDTHLENGIMISTKARDSKNFVAMLQFIDWLWYSDAGQVFAKWGVEGVTYTKDAAGNFKLADDVDFVGLNPKGKKHLQKDFGFSNGVFAYGGPTKLLESTFSAEEKEFQKAMADRKSLPIDPPHPLNDEETEQSTLWETPLKDYVNQNTLQFSLGQRQLSTWDAYQAELKAKHSGDYIDLVNKARERYVKEHG